MARPPLEKKTCPQQSLTICKAGGPATKAGKSSEKRRVFLVFGLQRASRVGNLILCAFQLPPGPCLITPKIRGQKKTQRFVRKYSLFRGRLGLRLAGRPPKVGVSRAREASFLKSMRRACTGGYVSYGAAGLEPGLGPTVP